MLIKFCIAFVNYINRSQPQPFIILFIQHENGVFAWICLSFDVRFRPYMKGEGPACRFFVRLQSGQPTLNHMKEVDALQKQCICVASLCVSCVLKNIDSKTK